MATKREKELLQLCKAIYDHFTSQTLQIAKKIIALEKEIEQDDTKPPLSENKPILEVKPVEKPVLVTGAEFVHTNGNGNGSVGKKPLPF